MNVFEEFLRELFTGEPMIREANICGRSVIGKVDDQIIVKIVLVSTERSKAIDAILYGTKGEPLQLRYEKADGHGVIKREFEGIVPNLERRYRETQSPGMRAEIESCMSETPCPACGGQRLKQTALAVTVGGKNIAELTKLSVVNAAVFLNSSESWTRV